tara:strand:- start:27 stop:191 length:165 start_codon:yes stop_codon:yes gene_type:complete
MFALNGKTAIDNGMRRGNQNKGAFIPTAKLDASGLAYGCLYQFSNHRENFIKKF